MAVAEKESTMEETSTWAVAAVCFVLLAVSIFIEHFLHSIGKWLKNKHKRALYEALEKIKAELMLLGFISLLLTVLQDPISTICIPKRVGATWHPCETVKSGTTKKDSGDSEDSEDSNGRKLLQFLDSGFSARRRLATKGNDTCTENGKVAFMSAYAIHQLHVFIFVLAVFHVIFSILTLALGRTKMRRWKAWEDETRTLEYQYHNDPQRFRFAKETSFGRRHMSFWSKSTVSLWVVCFFRQFVKTVTKVDYLTLRHGFIVAHLAPESETKFDFQKYIKRSLEEEFKVVVQISPIIWGFAVLFLLSNAYRWHSSLWLPFVPLFIILLVGTKLQVIITKMGLRIQERGDVIKGTPVVQPGDDLFWFGRPRFLLFLIHFVLFQNAFQLAFFAWSVYAFGTSSCFNKRTADWVIKLSTGVIIQVLCSYVTLPLYALVTQMGSSMKPTIFNDGVADALRSWHRTARKNTRQSHHHSETNSPFSSRPASPTHGMSPVHLLHNYQHSSLDILDASPRKSNVENDHLDVVELGFRKKQISGEEDSMHSEQQQEREIQGQSPLQLLQAPGAIRTQHEVNNSLSEFTFRR
ncbi:MLO-like protein 6 isoform X2 [Corylus avellana]|uniref:MLO-like protein 6 isoform X2 n=1 Tax=Corylus avellana TaxID=13451 RepID=UPI00286C77FD|nr:MLO-like protein 6 isoform X2 [Corylus avellana]